MSPGQLVVAAEFIASRWPEANIVRNGVGNLAWSTPGHVSDAFAWLDLDTGEVHYRSADGEQLVHPSTSAA